MTATTLDLRYRTREVLSSLDRSESVIVTFRGNVKASKALEKCPKRQIPMLSLFPLKVS